MTPAELTAARKALHFSQVELARILGIHPTMLNRWEKGRAKIPPYLRLVFKGNDYWSFQEELRRLTESLTPAR